MAWSLDACSRSLTSSCGPSPSFAMSPSRSFCVCQFGVSHRNPKSPRLRSPFSSDLEPFPRGILHRTQYQQSRSTTVYAAAPDLAATAGKTKLEPLTIKDAKIVAEPCEDKKIKIRVDIDGQASKRAFDTVLKDLARHAPPVPGFRKAKGGKTSVVPLNVIYQLMGPKLVRKFVVDEIIKATLLDYTEKEGIKAKNELKTDQSREELDTLFEPGKPFGFDATLDLEEDEQAQDSGRGGRH